MLRARGSSMQNPHVSGEPGAGGSALADHESPRDVRASATDAPENAVDFDVRAVWQECLSATDRYARLARAVLDELGSPGSAAPSGRRP